MQSEINGVADKAALSLGCQSGPSFWLLAMLFAPVHWYVARVLLPLWQEVKRDEAADAVPATGIFRRLQFNDKIESIAGYDVSGLSGSPSMRVSDLGITSAM